MAFKLIPNTPSNQALVVAVRAHDESGVRAALAKGASPNVFMDSYCISILTHAVQFISSKKDTAIVDLLLDAGADPLWKGDKGYQTAWVYFSRSASLDEVAKWWHRFPQLRTPVHVMEALTANLSSDRQAVFDFLCGHLASFADASWRDSAPADRLLLDVLYTGSRQKLQRWLDVNPQALHKPSVLSQALCTVIEKDHRELAALLMEAGASPFEKASGSRNSSISQMPYRTALLHNRMDIVDDIHQRYPHRSLSQWAKDFNFVVENQATPAMEKLWHHPAYAVEEKRQALKDTPVVLTNFVGRPAMSQLEAACMGYTVPSVPKLLKLLMQWQVHAPEDIQAALVKLSEKVVSYSTSVPLGRAFVLLMEAGGTLNFEAQVGRKDKMLSGDFREILRGLGGASAAAVAAYDAKRLAQHIDEAAAPARRRLRF